jgi:hypothetical protein
MRVRSATETLVIALHPVHHVVTTFVTWLRPIRNFIVHESGCNKNIIGNDVLIGLVVIVGMA